MSITMYSAQCMDSAIYEDIGEALFGPNPDSPTDMKTTYFGKEVSLYNLSIDQWHCTSHFGSFRSF